MSNYKSTLQTNNKALSANNLDLQSLIDQANSLPDAGGVELPKLPNEGSASDLMTGKELIDSEGNKVIGTFTIDTELATQDDLITQIANAVNNLPEAGSGGSDAPSLETCTVTFNNSDLGGDCGITAITATIIEDGVCKSYFYKGEGILDYIVSNVVCGTPITLNTHLGDILPAWADISGSATFDFSLKINSYQDWIMGFTAPSVANENCTIYYSYEA